MLKIERNVFSRVYEVSCWISFYFRSFIIRYHSFILISVVAFGQVVTCSYFSKLQFFFFWKCAKKKRNGTEAAELGSDTFVVKSRRKGIWRRSVNFVTLIRIFEIQKYTYMSENILTIYTCYMLAGFSPCAKTLNMKWIMNCGILRKVLHIQRNGRREGKMRRNKKIEYENSTDFHNVPKISHLNSRYFDTKEEFILGG